MAVKNWKSYCKEIWQDEDGWWATLKSGYFWGTDNNTVFNGETYGQLVAEAKYIHEGII